MGPKKKMRLNPEWFKNKASEQDKMLFRRALANYIAFDMPDDAPKPEPTAKTFKLVLPRVQELIPKWKQVTPENLSTHKWEMHKNFADVLRSLLETEHKLNQMIKEAKGEDHDGESDEGAEDE